MPTQQKKQQKKQQQQQKKQQKKSSSKSDAPIVNFLRPRKTEDVVEFAEAMVAGETPKLNAGVLSVTAYTQAWNDHFGAIEEGAATVPPLPNLYQPPVVQYAKHVNASAAQKTQGTKSRPSKWNENKLGAWEPGQGLGGIRLHHAEDARKLVENRDENVIAVGRAGEYVVGTTDTSAIHLIHASKTGNFGAIITAGKKLAADGVKGLDNLVGRFNDKVLVETLEDGSELVWLPYQKVTWGYLYRDDNDRPMTCNQIRNLDEGVTGIKFKPLNDPIRLNNLTLDELFKGVKRDMSLAATKDDEGLTDWDRFGGRSTRSGGEQKSPHDRTASNVGTLCRLSPKVMRCQGIKSLQVSIPIFHCFEGETIDDAELRVGFAVGASLPLAYAENTWQMRMRLQEVTQESTPPKKSKKAKSKKRKTKKAEPVSEPVEAEIEDTSDTSEAVSESSGTAN